MNKELFEKRGFCDVVFAFESSLDEDPEITRALCAVNAEGVAAVKISADGRVDFRFLPYGEKLTLKEYISSGALFMGDEHLISFYKNASAEAHALVRIAEKLQKGEKAEKTDFYLGNVCKNCGFRLPDGVEKCPRCLDKRKLVIKLLPFFKKYKAYMALVFLTMVISAAVALLAPYFSGSFYIDKVLTEGGTLYGKIGIAILFMAGVKLLGAVITSVQSIINAKVASRVVYDIKKTIFESVQRLSVKFFSARQTGGLMAQINRDSSSMYWFFCDGIPYFTVNILQIIGIVAAMFIINPSLAAFSLIPVPVFLALRRAVMALFRKLDLRDYMKQRAYTALVADVLSGMRVVKSFSREREEVERFDVKSRERADSLYTVTAVKNRLSTLNGYIFQLCIYIAWGVGGCFVMSGRGLGYGELVTFVGMISMLVGPLSSLNNFIQSYSEFINASNRVFEIIDAIPDLTEKKDPVRTEELRGAVEFKNVCFSYTKNKKTLEDVSFEVKAGETLGIVGGTGAGKSTIVNLLMRLYDTGSGEILVDGVNVKDYSFDTLRRNIAIVSQETYLFRGTIAENIAYAKPDADMAQIIAAAKTAGAHDFIIQNPDGYNTPIGIGAKELSGGERQRISIARAILRDPKILILDEATASMDTVTEQKIQNALTKLTRGRTTIIIAHRLSTLRDADKLVVIDNGKLAEAGTHSELMAQKGIYNKLYKLQLEALKVINE